jgi:hypothetical protein
MRLRCIGRRMACPFLLVGFDPRQIRPRLPAPRQARFRASPRQARPDYRRRAWGTPLAVGLKPSGNRTVKTLHRSVFRQSSGRAVTSLAARFPDRVSPLVFGLHKVTPTPARHKTAMRCFHQSSSCSKRPGSCPAAGGASVARPRSPRPRPPPCRKAAARGNGPLRPIVTAVARCPSGDCPSVVRRGLAHGANWAYLTAVYKGSEHVGRGCGANGP